MKKMFLSSVFIFMILVLDCLFSQNSAQIDYKYDKLNRLEEVSYSGVKILYEYDKLGNITKKTVIGLRDFNIPLTTGWNLISTHIQPQLPDTMNNVMSEIKSNLLIAKNNGGQVFIPSYDINTIGRWNVTQGYLVYMSAADTLSISGSEVVPSETPIQLSAGWNMMAYLRNSEMSAELAFASITDNNNLLIAKTLDGKVFIPSYQINTIGNLKSGVGYKVYVTTSDMLVYPGN